MTRLAARWWHVLRYYHKRQLAARLIAVGRRAIGRWTGLGSPRVALCGSLALRENPGFHRLAEDWLRGGIAGAREAACGATAPPVRQRNAGDILDGCFEFLNQQRRLGNPIDWLLARSRDVPRLWRFHLHYHEFLLDLAAESRSNPELLDRAWALVLDWIDHNPPNDPDAMDAAWHPYCISRRLPVWMVLCSIAPPPGGMSERVLGSIASQAEFLQRNLEWDLRGNHLLENARAVTLAGAFLAGPEADRWLRDGGRLFRAEIEEQILPHGEHFERSPMYHARMLEAVLDVRDAAERVAPELSEFCAGAAAKMAQFLESIVHPDGEIPLLGDSCFGETAPTPQILARASAAPRSPLPAPRSLPSAPCSPLPAPRSLPSAPCSPPSALRSQPSAPRSPLPALRSPLSAPYWVFRDGGNFLLFDAGPVGPDHLPAHAHADLLGIEASWNGRRLFVDSGVFNYEDDAMRQYCRSTAAHNVLQIDEQDQCDMWSRFRMGRRGWPGALETGCEDGFFWARATHTAYRRLGVPRVGRFLACRPGGPWFCVDWAEGKRTHRLTHRLHLDPSVQAARLSDAAVELRVGPASLRLEFLTPGRLTLDRAWHCPRFGVRIEAPVIRWDAESPLPAAVAWGLAPSSESLPTNQSLNMLVALASRAGVPLASPGVPLASRQCRLPRAANPAQPAISALLKEPVGATVDGSDRSSHSEWVPPRLPARLPSGNLS